MKVLVLSDATWQNLERVLERSDEGLEVLTRMTAPAPELPDQNELLVATTDPSVTPAVFEQIREQREALTAAVDQLRARTYELARAAKTMRVSVPALARWTGISEQQIYAVLKTHGPQIVS